MSKSKTAAAAQSNADQAAYKFTDAIKAHSDDDAYAASTPH